MRHIKAVCEYIGPLVVIGGEELIRRLSDTGLARIGSMPRFGDADRQFFVDSAKKLAQLDEAKKSMVGTD